VPFNVYTKLIKIFLIILATALHRSVLYFFLAYLGNNNYYWHAVLHKVPFISSFLIAGADQVLMSSMKGLPSDYAVLYCMLDAQLFLRHSPYFRNNTICYKYDNLGVTHVTHQVYKHLDMTLFSWTSCDYICHGISHNLPKTTTKISSTRHFFLEC